MMKKHLLFLFVALLPLLVGAQTQVEIDGIWYNLISKAKLAEVISGDTEYSDSIIIPDIVTYEGTNYSVTSIKDYAFKDCSSLTSITIPESVRSIEDRVFYGCSKLTTIVLPKNLWKIGGAVFANCSELLDMYCYAETPPSTYNGIFNGSYPEYATLHVPACALNDYKATAPWSSFGTIVELTDEDMKLCIDHLEITNEKPTEIFDLRGQRVTNTVGLKGIYIVNGKKVIIK